VKYANMHLHSTYSDGIFTPLQLCSMIKDMGYGALSLTDHQCAAGAEELKKAASAFGLACIPGMELYAYAPGGSLVHLTAYDFDPTFPAMSIFLKKETESAMRQTEAQLAALHKAGLFHEITWQDVLDVSLPGAWLCNEQVFLALQTKAGYTQKDYWSFIASYHAVSPENAVHSPIPTTSEMIGLVRNAGGMIFLAHPHRITDLLEPLYKEGLMGVEYDHPDIDSVDTEKARAFALSHRMYLSGGTDHTGIPGDNMERGDIPGRSDGGDGSLVPYDADVRNGITLEEFQAIRDRIYG